MTSLILPLLLLLLPLVLWNHVGWEIYGRAGPWWRWLPDHWPYARESTYPSGSLLQFAFFLPAVVGPLILPATLVGAVRSLRREGEAPAEPGRRKWEGEAPAEPSLRMPSGSGSAGASSSRRCV